jgi:hypothetical protein
MREGWLSFSIPLETRYYVMSLNRATAAIRYRVLPIELELAIDDDEQMGRFAVWENCVKKTLAFFASST